MSTRVSFSVALCTFNGARYLGEQLSSILGQTRLPEQIVVCDDGSTDGSVELASALLAKSSVPYRLERNAERLGVSRNFEKAIRLCEQEVVAFSDQDDVWRPNKLGTLEAAFASRPDVALVFSNARIIDGEGHRLDYTQWDSVLFGPAVRARHHGELLTVLLRYPVVCGATLAVRREIAQRCMPVAEEWLHDEWISLLCAATVPVHWVDAELMDYRVHGAQEVGAARPTLQRQIATAKRMDHTYFSQQVRRFERLQERVERWEPKVREDARAALEAKLAYLRRRTGLFAGTENPWSASTQLLASGAHARFGLGLKSWLHDVGHAVVFGRSRKPK